jgi:hypothetical protein
MILLKRALLSMVQASLVLGLICISPAIAEEPVFRQKWYFNVGSAITEYSTDASVGFGESFGTFLRVEDDLGIESDESIFRLEGLYRFNEKHALEVGYWSADRSGTRSLDLDVEFDGVIYEAGAVISSELDARYVRLGWRGSLIRSDRGEAGFSAGLSTFGFDASIEGVGFISDPAGGGESGVIRAEQNVFVPAPTVGLFVNYVLYPGLVLRAEADYLDIEFDDYEGTLSEVLLGLDWYITRHFGIGVGTLTTRIDFKDTGDDPLLVDYRQNSFLAYLVASF